MRCFHAQVILCLRMFSVVYSNSLLRSPAISPELKFNSHSVGFQCPIGVGMNVSMIVSACQTIYDAACCGQCRCGTPTTMMPCTVDNVDVALTPYYCKFRSRLDFLTIP